MISRIEKALISCNEDRFATITRAYLAYRYKLTLSTGTAIGQEKSKAGVPDNLIPVRNGFYIFCEITTQEKQLVDKLEKDIESCFKQQIIAISKIVKILLICNRKITPSILETLQSKKNEYDLRIELEVIGIDSFADEIFKDYPSLCRLLEIPIDTSQILEVQDFVEMQEKSRFSTSLKNKFFHRDNELAESQEIFEKDNFIVVTGQAGVGKTRFAIELAERFIAKNNDYYIKILTNNGNLDIWNDLKSYILTDNKYVLILDDANKLKSNLEQVLNFVKSKKQSDLKIIITARKYALPGILKFINATQTIELKKLSLDELVDVLSTQEFNISENYIKRIFSISKGNPRLSIMAANAALNGSLEMIHSAYQIHEQYFNSLSQVNLLKANRLLLKVAGILSLFGKISILDEVKLGKICDLFELCKEDLLIQLELLFNAEIADKYEGVYKISDQILGEYNFYLAFIKNKEIPFIKLLDFNHSNPNFKLIDYLTPIINNYGFEYIKALIIDDIKLKWKEIKKSAIGECRFLSDFSFYLPTESMIYLRSRIQECDFCSLDELDFITHNESHHLGYDDEILDLLIKLLYNPKNLDITIELLLSYGISNQLVFSKLIKILTESTVYNDSSFGSKYELQTKLFNILYLKVNENEMLYSRLILLIAPKYLVCFYETHSYNGNTITLRDKTIALTTEMIEFRKKLWNFVFQTYTQEGLRKNFFIFFASWKYSLRHNVPDILEYDKSILIKSFKKHFITCGAFETHLVNRYVSILDNMKLSYPSSIKTDFQSVEYDEWCKISSEDLVNEKYLEQFFNGYNIQHFKELIQLINRIYHSSICGNFKGWYNLQSSLSLLLMWLENKDFVQFMSVFKEVLKCDFHKELNLGRVIGNIKYNEKKAALMRSFLLKNSTAGSFYANFILSLKGNLFREEDYYNYLKCIKQSNNNNFSYLENVIPKLIGLKLDEVKQLEEIIDFLFKRTKALERFFIDPHFFKFISIAHKDVFDRKFKQLITIYLRHEVYNRHDYSLEIMLVFLESKSSFIHDILNYKFGDSYFISKTDLLECKYQNLWKAKDYKYIIKEFILYVAKSESSVFTNTPSVICEIFVGNNNGEKEMLFSLIEEYKSNPIIVKCVFNIVVVKYPELRFDFLILIISNDCPITLFIELDFYTNSATYSGSRIPRLNVAIDELGKYIDYLEGLVEVKFLEHVEILEDKIRYLQKDIEYEKRSEFLEEWSF